MQNYRLYIKQNPYKPEKNYYLLQKRQWIFWWKTLKKFNWNCTSQAYEELHLLQAKEYIHKI